MPALTQEESTARAITQHPVACAAYLSAGVTIAPLVTGILFFTVGKRFGKMNDAASVFQMLFMLPIAVGLFSLARPYGVASPLVAAAIGITGMLIATVLQALLVLGAVKYEQTIAAVPMADGAVGLWLLLVNFPVSTARIVPDGLAIPDVIAGAGYILSVVGFHLGGEQRPLFYGGAFLGVLTYSAWAIWVGGLLVSGGLIVPG